jgi:hypothetical protein
LPLPRQCQDPTPAGQWAFRVPPVVSGCSCRCLNVSLSGAGKQATGTYALEVEGEQSEVGQNEALNRQWEETMKTRYTVALSILAGVAVGAAAVQALHAQAKPPAYVVAEIDVTKLEPYDKEYVPLPRKPLRTLVANMLFAAAGPLRFSVSRPNRASL